MLEMSKGLLVNVCFVPPLSCPPPHCILPGAEDGPLQLLPDTAGVVTDRGDRPGKESGREYLDTDLSDRALLCLQRRTVEWLPGLVREHSPFG